MLYALIHSERNVLHYAVSFFSGMILMLTLPPLFVGVGVCVFSFMYLLIHATRSKKKLFWLGWWFGFGFFVPGFYWISHSLLVDPWRFAWLIPFALTLIPAISAIFTGLWALSIFFIPFNGLLRCVCFALLWVFFEFIRGEITQFPWNFIGYSWGGSDVFIQSAYLIKVYGMSFLAVFLGTLPALMLKREERGFVSHSVVKVLCLVMVVFTAMWGYGQWRITSFVPEGRSVNVRIVQANIEQLAVTSEEQRLETFKKHIEMTKMASDEKLDVIVWPESAVPYILEKEAELLQLIGDAIPEGAILVTGGIRMQGKPGDEDFRYWNSLFVINSEGGIIAKYDKSILVPFGEFVPFNDVLPFFEKITEGLADFNPGDGAKVLSVKQGSNILKLIPLICYEGAFSDYLLGMYSKMSGGIIVNVTNDAWFGDSIGPYQHFYKAKFRAVESFSPLIRAANTGVSSVFDALGRSDEKGDLNQSSVLDIKVWLND